MTQKLISQLRSSGAMAQDGIRWPYHVAQYPDGVAGLTEQV